MPTRPARQEHLLDMSITDANTNTSDMHQYELERQARLEPLLRARLSLKCQVEKLLSTHWNDQPPPFTSPELIVMAIIVSDTKYRTMAQIVDWVRATFPYFDESVKSGEKAAEEHYHYEFQLEDAMDYIGYIEFDFKHAFGAYDVPLVEHDKGYGISIESARICLQRWAKQQRKGTIRFLDLPPELRNQIYGMLLTFPGSAVKVEGGLTHPSSIELWTYGQATGRVESEAQYLILKPSRILDIALVNGQLARESLDVFYGSTKFILDSFRDILCFVKAVPLRHMRLIKKLQVSFQVFNTMWEGRDHRVGAAFEVLAKTITSLNSIDIKMVDKSWMSCGQLIGQKEGRTWYTPRDNSSLRGITALAAKAKASSFYFDDDFHLGSLEFAEAMKISVAGEIQRLKGGNAVIKNGHSVYEMVIESA